ncbi:hypothetical protein [Roseovarius amoyensis]|uniref:hypothetical protein n=1 Tax=Roseovarius amoyensis TaxID=2211448 RepID=UPI0013A6BC33|nr:hypothetical protein [Roseovarius amoyensis]
MIDTYGPDDTTARCSNCGKFMPWHHSCLVEKSDGMPLPSPILVEMGICSKCEAEKMLEQPQ